MPDTSSDQHAEYERQVNVAGLFTSVTDEWATPLGFFATLDAEFGFTLDPCAAPHNTKCEQFFTREDDGLARPWPGIVFMNPPYGRGIGDWIEKAHNEAREGSIVVCLIPARTDTAYWHDHVMRADEVRFVRGRMHFDGERKLPRRKGSHYVAPFPSVVAVFRPEAVGPPIVSAIDRDGQPLLLIDGGAGDGS